MKKITRPKFKKISLKRPRIKSLSFLTSLLFVLGLVGFGASGYFWFKDIFTQKDRVFYSMVETSLRTPSVTRVISQSEASRVEVQNLHLGFRPNIVSESHSTVDQVTATREKSSVSTETIGIKGTDFVRYSNINVPAEEAGGSDFKNIIGVWAKKDASSGASEEAQFLNEAIFTFVPFGNFSVENRDKLMKILKDTKTYELGDHSISMQNGRPVMHLQVALKPRGLITMLAEYAEITGVGNKDQLDPNQYEDKNSFIMDLKIDMISSHLLSIEYPGQVRKEEYAAYGMHRNVELPRDTISVEELQGRLQ